MLALFHIENILMTMVKWSLFFYIVNNLEKAKLPKKNIYLQIVLIYISTIYICSTNIFGYTKVFFFMIVSIIFYKVSYYKVSYNGTFLRYITIPVLFWLKTIILDLLYLIAILSSKSIYSVNSLFSMYIKVFIIIFFIKIAVLALGYKIFNHLNKKLEIKSNNIDLLGIQILMNLISIIFLSGYKLIITASHQTNIYINHFIVTLLILSCIASILLINKIIREDKVKLENEIIKERMNSSIKNYENIQDIVAKVRHIKVSLIVFS